MLGSSIFNFSPSLIEEYHDLKTFYRDSFWGNILIKIGVSVGYSILVLFPLNIQKDVTKLRFSSFLGFVCLFLITIVFIIQLPSYISYYNDNNIPYDINVFDIVKSINDDKFAYLSVFSTILYSYTCHYGIFAVYNTIHNHTDQRMYKVIERSVILDGFFYTAVGILGYLTVPQKTPTFILDRFSIGNTDYLMTVCRLLTIVIVTCKLPVKFNSFRNSTLNLIYKSPEVVFKRNLIITIPFTIATSLISALFSDIGTIIDFLGGFCATTIAFTLPVAIFIKSNKYKITHYSNICAIVFFGIFIFCGYFTAGISLHDMFTGKMNG